MIEGSCHCGAVTFKLPRRPDHLTECNCSVCGRLGTLWGYYVRPEVELVGVPGATLAYIRGDKMLEFHTCKTCGCTTHWQGTPDSDSDRIAFNFRLVDPKDRTGIRIRHFDGADSWEFLD